MEYVSVLSRLSLISRPPHNLVAVLENSPVLHHMHDVDLSYACRGRSERDS
jgi:hypothetical protein